MEYAKAVKASCGQAKYDYVQELHCLLHDKKVTLGEISVHLMKDRLLAPNEKNEFGKPDEFKYNLQVHNL